MKRRSVLRVAAMALLCCATGARADAGAIVTAEGDRSAGEIELTDANTITLTPADGPAQAFPLADLQSVLLRPDLSPGLADVKFLDNDGQHPAQTTSNSIKLKAGLHRLTVAYWQGAGDSELRLEFEGPELSRRVVPGSMLFNVKNEVDPPASEGFDAQGLRIPEAPDAVRPRIRYRFFDGDENAAWKSVAVFQQLEQKRSGTSDQIGLRVSNQAAHFGVVFAGYFKAPADGEYTFHLTSDDGAIMWWGKDPAMIATLGAGTTAPDARPWKVTLADNAEVAGRIDAIDDAGITLRVPVGEDALTLVIPREHIAAVTALGRAAKPLPPAPGATQDTAYVLRQIGEGEEEVRAVSGRAIGAEDGQLVFEYRGEARRIAMDKLVALIPATPETPAGNRRAFSQRFDLLAGHVLPGTWLGLDAQSVSLRTTWGQAVSVPRTAVAQVRMVGGRLIYLADAEPDDIRQTPYFDRAMPVKRNQAIGGGELTIFNGPPIERGFAVAGRTLLHFELGAGFERLTTRAAIHKPTGELADVDVRVLGDGKILFEKKGLTAQDTPANIDVDITGVNRLTLETDFGGGQDVGDRVVWADPRVIRKRGAASP